MPARLYNSFAIITITSVFLLIAVGSIVRATGAGMGCPDWPKCFGMWIPPTMESELPVNYKEIFGAKLKGEVKFNPIKTWIEYVNRLLGVLIGIFIFITLLSSYFAFWKNNRKLVWFSLVAFLLVCFEGWLGSKVVSTELLPWTITIHLIGALLVVMVLIYTYIQSRSLELKEDSSVASIFLGCMMLSFGQFILGTRVREKVDSLDQLGILRSDWLDSLGGAYWIHLFFAIVVLTVHLFFYFKMKSDVRSNPLVKTVVLLVVANFVSGLLFHFLGLVAWNQPIHLFVSSLILGGQFSAFLVYNTGRLSIA